MNGSRGANTLDLGREAIFAGGFIGVIWFGAYLYEFGFLARFGVPPTLADVGFPKTLTLAFLLGSAGGFLGSLGLILAGMVEGDMRSAFVAAALAAAMTIAAYGVALDGWAVPIVMSAESPLMPAWLRLPLIACVIVVAARIASTWLSLSRRGEPLRICRNALLALLMMFVPMAFGWMGGTRKVEARGTFLYLAEDPDFVLVRLYDEQAVFVRYDRSTRTFRDQYRVVTLGKERTAAVTFTLPVAAPAGSAP